MTAPHCEKCNRTRAEMKCHLDVYNDTDDFAGNLICDDCIYAEACAAQGPAAHMPARLRPEGYYHAPIGTFD